MDKFGHHDLPVQIVKLRDSNGAGSSRFPDPMSPDDFQEGTHEGPHEPLQFDTYNQRFQAIQPIPSLISCARCTSFNSDKACGKDVPYQMCNKCYYEKMGSGQPKLWGRLSYNIYYIYYF